MTINGRHVVSSGLCFAGHRDWAVPAPAILATLALSACSGSPGATPGELNAAYESALEETTAPVSFVFEAESSAEQAALDRLSDYFETMTAASVGAETGNVYSDDAWLYDNLIAIQGVDEIRRYFDKAASEVDSLAIEFLQIARSNEDYFIRWRMTIVAPRLADAEPLVSYGMTQFRFDAEGKVLLHRDFWDAGTGLYEYIPVFGSLVYRARSTLADYSGHVDD